MSKTWKIAPQAEKSFIEKFPGYSRLVLQLLYNRGLTGENDIEAFLNPDSSEFINDPLLFKNTAAAVDRIIEHIKAGNKIIVYGDYDADGVTASVLMVETLAVLKARTDIYIPYRQTEGYGLNRGALDEIKEKGAKLIITVDNGIRNYKEVEYARELGLEIIITDHHVPPEEESELPDCLIIDPLMDGEKYPYKGLAGVAVAYKLASALIDKSTLAAGDKTSLKERLMDLVAIGTVADCVSLLGENRVLVKKGLEALNRTRRIGLLELIKIAGLEPGRLNAWNIGFQIGPRLNAAGRLDHANTAFEVLITRDKEEARDLAQRLNESNIERQKITETTFAQAVAQIDGDENDGKLVVAVSPSVRGQGEAWNEGVVGLVAGRICEKYSLPALVFTGNTSDIKGSGRSIEGFSLISAIEENRAYLDKYGGHALAAGVTIKDNDPDNLDKFLHDIRLAAKNTLDGRDTKPVVGIEAELDAAAITEELIEDISRFEPFGQDNPRPKFVTYAMKIMDIFHMGADSQHIKLKLSGADSNGKSFNALGFGQAETWKDLKIGESIDIVHYPEINEFNGRREVQLKIVDIKINPGNS